MTCTSIGCVVVNGLIGTAEKAVGNIYDTLFASWPGQTIVTLYAIIVGYLIMMGHAGERTRQWATSIVLLLSIAGFASNFDTFSEWIGLPIWDAAVKAASLAASDGGTSDGGLGAVLNGTEESLGKVFAIIDNIEVPGNFITNAWLYLKVGVVVLILALLVCGMYLTMVALLCIAGFSLMVMFAVGGPCLWLASFAETRHVTWAWVRAIANYALWIFFIGLVAGIANYGVDLTVAELARWDLERDGVFNQTVGAQMLIAALSIYMLLKTSDWAAAITGGTAANTGLIGAIGGVAGGAIGSGVNALGSMAGGAAKWGGGVLANRTPVGGMVRAYSRLKGLGNIK